ncbi:MAG: 3-oxoadipate enol-lactonase [Actinobacteria bacterium]|jgi:pimeloyl-ACP methyl ester carboxylesterase|nr:3-oxoadipate enol-lactonase [Actinomycetota bacterium]|tara:strand:+ start:9851 stop:10630 length:780 start_codon:yes stop_codon:yes gene_type:complete
MRHQPFTRVDGVGPPLVLIHGVGLDHTMWDLVVDRLAEIRTVVRYDISGHGRTPDQPGERSIDDFVDELLCVLQAQGLVRPEVAGISMGGMIALAASARRPDLFDKVALLNTVADRTAGQVAGLRERLAAAESDGMQVVAEMAIDRWFEPDWHAEHPYRVAAVGERLCSTDLVGYLKAYRLFIDGDPLMPKGAARISAPVLAMTGELDVGSTPAMSTALAESVQNGQARILNNLHHLPPIEDPDVFATALIDFLEREAQ